MSPQLVFTTSESTAGGSGVPTSTGPAFIAIATDAGPPPSGPSYVKCQSLTDLVNAFGPRSSTSATGYDWLDEFFHDGGQAAYVTRVTDVSAAAATLTLNDALPSPKPTVLVTALTAGSEGNDTFVAVAAGTNATFTATTASSTALTAISSFKNIGVGTPVSGTGIAAGTYIASVNTGASSAVLSQAATASGSGVTITPGTATVTVLVEDTSGNQIADEVHGPYFTTAQLIADTSSAWVSFSQSAGSGFTTNLPTTLVSTALSGGADPDDLTDALHVAALANFPASLGAGTVALPGKTSTTAWNGLDAHAAANNRFSAKDMADSSSSAAVNAAAATQAASSGYVQANSGKGVFVQGSLLLPGVVPNATRTVPGSAAVAALRAQVAQTNNQAQCPCGSKWPLSYPLGFTEFFGPVPAAGLPAGSFAQSDVNSMEAAGVNCFANFNGALCLFGFVTGLSSSVEPVFDQATATAEAMALEQDAQAAMAPYLFDDINLATIEQMTTDLNTVGLNHYNGGALYDGGTGQASNAFEVVTGGSLNTPATAQAKQLNAQLVVKIVRYADTVNIKETVVPVSVALPVS